MSVRALVVGAGSIGTRHARNLDDLGAFVSVTDPDSSRAAAVGVGEVVPFDLDAAVDHDVVVLASPSRFHAAQLRHVLPLVDKAFVEKPMVMNADETSVIAGAEDRVMVGCNLRFHEPVRRIHDAMVSGRIGDVVGGRFWFGSWLPDWRPRVDYRTTYSARADLGGGVLLDAIHELDLAQWFFGEDLRVRAAVVDRLGPLEIDVEDTVRAVLSTPEGVPVDISLDLLSRRYRRGIELIGTDATARLDWDGNVLDIDGPTGRDRIVVDVSLDASYVAEASHLLDWVRGGPPPPVDGHGGAAAVRMADSIRDAARTEDRQG